MRFRKRGSMKNIPNDGYIDRCVLYTAIKEDRKNNKRFVKYNFNRGCHIKYSGSITSVILGLIETTGEIKYKRYFDFYDSEYESEKEELGFTEDQVDKLANRWINNGQIIPKYINR